MSELKMNQLTIQDGRIFLDDKEIQCVEEFNLKSSTDGTAELSLKMLVDLVSMRLGQHDRDDSISDSFSKEQLICIARHLKAFHENAVNNEIANWAAPCRGCKLLGSNACGQGNILIDANSILWEKAGTGMRWELSSVRKKYDGH